MNRRCLSSGLLPSRYSNSAALFILGLLPRYPGTLVLLRALRAFQGRHNESATACSAIGNSQCTSTRQGRAHSGALGRETRRPSPGLVLNRDGAVALLVDKEAVFPHGVAVCVRFWLEVSKVRQGDRKTKSRFFSAESVSQ